MWDTSTCQLSASPLRGDGGSRPGIGQGQLRYTETRLAYHRDVSAAVGEEEVLEDSEVGHGRIHHGGEGVFVILTDNNVASPGVGLCERLTLDVLHAFVDRKGHSVSGYSWVENDIWVCELLVHPIDSLDKLMGVG